MLLCVVLVKLHKFLYIARLKLPTNQHCKSNMSTKTKTTNTQTSKMSTKPPYNQQHASQPFQQSPFPGESVESMKTLHEIVKERTEDWDYIADEYGQYGCPYWEYDKPTPKEPLQCPFCHYTGFKCTCPTGSPTELNIYMSRSWEEVDAEWEIKNNNSISNYDDWFFTHFPTPEEKKYYEQERDKAWANLQQQNVKTKNIFEMRKDKK